MPYVNNDSGKSFASSGVGNTALALAATALGTNLFGNGLGGLFNGGNPTANATYQLSQKDSEIAELKAERYADQQLNLVQLELSNVKQRLAAIEAAAPLREKILGDSILALQANLANISGYMVKASALPEA